jgi:hypothetical protein
MIIGLTGYAQSGKDTVANVFVEQYGFTRVAFADKIREFLYEFNPVVVQPDLLGSMYLRESIDLVGWDKAKQDPEVRRMLQDLGVSARKVFSEDFWIKQAIGAYQPSDNVIVTDVRFTNEADYLKSFPGAQIWRIKRLGIEAVNAHESESQMDDYKVDQIFINNGSIEDLTALIKARMVGLLA